MKRLSLVLAVASLAVVGCDTKETRSGSITLSGGSNIPLNDRSGAHAELVAGPAQLTFQKGSKDSTIAILVRQPNRADVNVEAPITGDYRTGNFTLRGSDIGQPVDLVSARRYTVTGPNQRYTNWEDRGFERCMVEYSWDPCDEDWTVAFHAAAGDVGAFAARTPTRCNERSNTYACRPTHREPHIPDFPRDRHPRRLDKVLSVDPGTLKFD